MGYTVNIQWLKGKRHIQYCETSPFTTVTWPAHLSAGEPMITLWIRMPCVTSGKDGSLSFNSAMMLKQKGENRNTTGLRHSGASSVVTTFFNVFSRQAFLIVKHLPLCQRQHHYTNVPPLRLWLAKPRTLERIHKNRMCENHVFNKKEPLDATENRKKWVWCAAFDSYSFFLPLDQEKVSGDRME